MIRYLNPGVVVRFLRSPRTLWRWLRRRPKRSIAIFMAFAHVLGMITSFEVLNEHRSPTGSVAWVITLNTAPYLAVPAYWIFGHQDFEGYRSARRSVEEQGNYLYEAWLQEQRERSAEVSPPLRVLEKLAGMPFMDQNEITLMPDGSQTFKTIFEIIDGAKDYILLQYYIVRSDRLGKQLRDKLLAKAREGVRIYFLYDEVGCVMLDSQYIDDLRAGGVDIRPFGSNIEGAVDFRLNFRNHRKVTIVDGQVAVTGGCNIGDEYVGEDPDIGEWRDTNVLLRGPVVRALQVPFSEDWRWAAGEEIQNLHWEERSGTRNSRSQQAICLPTGPADDFETCALVFHTLIGAASERVWITTPYFVPDLPTVSALQLAALRGVDVRILLPKESDSRLAHLSSFTYLEPLEKAGVKVFRYDKGFLHQKVILVDDTFASIGTANFDNRSFRLNFEVNIGVSDRAFAAEVAAMLRQDFQNAIPARASDLQERGFLFQMATRVSRLLAPIQ